MTLTFEEQNRFEFHPAGPLTGRVHDEARSTVLAAALRLSDLVPAGRHRSLMLTALEEAMHWANAAIACEGQFVPAQPPSRSISEA